MAGVGANYSRAPEFLDSKDCLENDYATEIDIIQ